MCGIIGILNAGKKPAFSDIYRGLHAIQHRGQDAAGILTYSNRFNLVKGPGLVRDVFREEHAAVLQGSMGLGHVRYPTVGKGTWQDAQPFWTPTPFGIGMAHNGNITNFFGLKEHFHEVHQSHINSDCDVEAVLGVLGNEILRQNTEVFEPKNFFKAVGGVFKRVKGAYSVVGLIAGRGLFAFRDPYGIRPLIMGQREEEGEKSFCIASESVALDLLDHHGTSNLKPGEAVFIETSGRLHREIIQPREHRPCIFEMVYFARPDSFLDHVSVYKTRGRLGNRLAEDWKKTGLTVDSVVPVPESATTAAISLSRELDIPYREALVKNRYVGRTFIMPDDRSRRDSVRMKLNPIQIEFEGKDVLLVDDSIVRGNTSKSIISIARKAGARKVYMAIYSPPLCNACVYGIDMSTKKDFIAKERTVEQIAGEIGADHLVYLGIDDLVGAAREGNPDIKKFCTACFTGDYPTGDVTDEILRTIEEDRTHKQ